MSASDITAKKAWNIPHHHLQRNTSVISTGKPVICSYDKLTFDIELLKTGKEQLPDEHLMQLIW